MFPNVRLLVVAVLAAIAGIACGLGLFATFRVNHEPLARFSEGGPPLQLTFDKLAPMPDTAAPVAARYPLNCAAKPLSAPVLISPPNPAPDPADSGSTDTAAEKIALANSTAQIEEPAVKQTKARASDVAKPPAKAARSAKP